MLSGCTHTQGFVACTNASPRNRSPCKTKHPIRTCRYCELFLSVSPACCWQTIPQVEVWQGPEYKRLAVVIVLRRPIVCVPILSCTRNTKAILTGCSMIITRVVTSAILTNENMGCLHVQVESSERQRESEGRKTRAGRRTSSSPIRRRPDEVRWLGQPAALQAMKICPRSALIAPLRR